ncbi:MAG: hypothetical protein V3U56_11900 [Syntrophobacteria bacterium]|jgi:hypothetical protein
MNWEQIRREDTFQGSHKPFISISMHHIGFNTMFTRIAELGPDKRVTVYAKPEELRLGFEFHKDEEAPDSFALALQSSDKKGKKRKSVMCSARGIVLKYPWLEAVAKLPKAKDRRFEPKKVGNLWVIELCPAFEHRKSRKSKDISSDLGGIYRYRRENGKIVYIGKGAIKNRLMLPERQEWDFDVVEYSIIEDPDQQVRWETYWIDRFKEENNGELPHHNKVSGAESNTDR